VRAVKSLIAKAVSRVSTLFCKGGRLNALILKAVSRVSKVSGLFSRTCARAREYAHIYLDTLDTLDTAFVFNNLWCPWWGIQPGHHGHQEKQCCTCNKNGGCV